MVVPTMDKLPRVPDAHGDVIDEKIFSDLYIRTSWVDANVALDQIKRVSVLLFNVFRVESRDPISYINHTLDSGGTKKIVNKYFSKN